MEDEHMTVRVDVHAWHFPELNARGKPGPVLHFLIGTEWSGARGHCRTKARGTKTARHRRC
jgi:hypothetical protein